MRKHLLGRNERGGALIVALMVLVLPVYVTCLVAL